MSGWGVGIRSSGWASLEKKAVEPTAEERKDWFVLRKLRRKIEKSSYLNENKTQHLQTTSRKQNFSKQHLICSVLLLMYSWWVRQDWFKISFLCGSFGCVNAQFIHQLFPRAFPRIRNVCSCHLGASIVFSYLVETQLDYNNPSKIRIIPYKYFPLLTEGGA